MRSSKSRSRNKSNRNRSVGNIVNRVFDSSGPEGKVRGTPQQIIDKYNQLARDAQLSGDRVATENFQQHAEHYLRMLGAAQKEQDKQREQQDKQREQQDKQREQQDAENRKRQSERDKDKSRQDQDGDAQPVQDAPQADPGAGDQPEVLDVAEPTDDSGLVETPESKSEEAPKSKPKRTYTRKPRAKKSDSDGGPDNGSSEGGKATAAE